MLYNRNDNIIGEASSVKHQRGSIKMANKFKVTICGKDYTLTSEDSKEYTQKLAAILDKRIRDMKAKFSSLSITDCAVLTALDCMDELAQSNKNIDNIRSQIKDYVDDANRARTQSNSSQREIKALKEKIEMLEKELQERTNYTGTNSNDTLVSAKDMLSQDIEKALGTDADDSDEGEQLSFYSKKKSGNNK